MTQAKQLDQIGTSTSNEARFDVDRREYVDGVLVEHVRVFDESQLSPTAIETRGLLDEWDRELAGSDALPPLFDYENGRVIARNPMSAFLYDGYPDLEEWGLLMPSARALHYLTHLDEVSMPSGALISEHMRQFVVDSYDGIGIRSRKRVAGALIGAHLGENLAGGECVSLACGAADLMLEQIANDQNHSLTLVDIDDLSLDLAAKNAAQLGLQRGTDYRVLDADITGDNSDRNLVRSMIRSDSLVQRLGAGSQRVAEALGINEYFPDRLAARFLANSYKLVAPGGMLVTSNMLADRPQMNVNRLVAGWTSQVKPRSVRQIIDMLRKAGLPLEKSQITIPEDGVYAVITVQN